MVRSMTPFKLLVGYHVYLLNNMNRLLDGLESYLSKQNINMNLSIHKCVCNVMTDPNPTQYTKFEKSKLKTKQRKLYEIN